MRLTTDVKTGQAYLINPRVKEIAIERAFRFRISHPINAQWASKWAELHRSKANRDRAKMIYRDL